MSKPPYLIRNHLHAGTSPKTLLLVSGSSVRVPEPAVTAVIGTFTGDGRGGFVVPAKAVSGNVGYLNGDGEWAHPPELADARNFSEDGLARFYDGQLWGYLNLDLKVAIAPRFEEAEAFAQGLAAVRNNGKWRFIDRGGEFTFARTFERVARFTEAGLAVASEGRSKGIGYIDREGNWAIPPRFARALTFSKVGVAPVSIDGERFGLIDTRGQWVMEPTDLDIREFNADGLAYCYGPGSQHYFIDSRGKVVIEGDYRLAKHMVSGLVLDGENDFVSVAGKLETSAQINWAETFGPHGFSIARSRSNHRGTHWGLLNKDGTFRPAPPDVSEPLTDYDGYIVDSEYGTPLATFATKEGDVALIDATGAVAYRLGRISANGTEAAALFDAAGEEIWRGQAHERLPRMGYFFHADPEQFFEHTDDVDGITTVAETMLAEVEARLHALAAGELAQADGDDDEDGEDEDEDEVDDEDEDDEEEYDSYDDDDDNDQLDAVSAAAKYVGETKRIYRDYLNEQIWGTYTFLSDDRGELSEQVKLALIARLTERFGLPDPDPDFAGEAPASGILAWPVSLQQPVNGAQQEPAETRRLWLGLSASSDSGDGDVWFHIHLHCMPSIETLEIAMLACDALEDDGDEEEDEQDEDEHEEDATVTQSYQDWMATIIDEPRAIGAVPLELVDDAMADAAVAASGDAYENLPAAFQTAARLEAIIRSSAHNAAWLPVACMTADALALARSLYAEDSDWHYRDERNSRLPQPPYDQNSLCDIWGCLVTQELAYAAIDADVSLGEIPRWLRTAELEQYALEFKIMNMIWLRKEQITADIAAQAVLERYSELIEYVPDALRTAAVCLASVQVRGTTLRFVPKALRTVDLCAAAMRNEPQAFADVPNAIREQACTRLIEEDQAAGTAGADGGTRWHGLRAWSRLWSGDDAGAIADASLSIAHVPYPVHAHFVMACAYDSLGDGLRAARAAAALLAIWDDYEPEFGSQNHTAWLKELAQSAMQSADDATILAELANHPQALSQVPQRRVTQQMVDTALAADSAAVRYVPKRLMTASLYGKAIESGVKDAAQVPAHLWDESLAITVARHSRYEIKHIPPAYRTLEVYRAAVKADADAIVYVPEDMREQLG